MLLGIYGSGGLGREVLELSNQINAILHKWDDIIFIDDTKTEGLFKNHKIYPFEEILKNYKHNDVEITIAIGEPDARKKLWNKISEYKYSFATLIHPNVYITENTKIGYGTTICSGAYISCDVEICENVYIQPQVCIGHDCKIGKHSVLSPSVALAGNCNIGEGVYIAMSVPVKEKVNIGSESIIGMGSVVIRDIPDNVIALGNPARVMKKNTDKKVF